MARLTQGILEEGLMKLSGELQRAGQTAGWLGTVTAGATDWGTFTDLESPESETPR